MSDTYTLAECVDKYKRLVDVGFQLDSPEINECRTYVRMLREQFSFGTALAYQLIGSKCNQECNRLLSEAEALMGVER